MHIIRIIISSLFISAILEFILILLGYSIESRSLIWIMLSYPLTFLAVFCILSKCYSSDSIKTEMIDLFDNQYEIPRLYQAEDVKEFQSSEEYIKKIKTKILLELMILSPIIILIVMLFSPEISKNIVIVLFVSCFGLMPFFFKIFMLYRNLLLDASQRKIVFNDDSILFLNRKTDCEDIKYIDIAKVFIVKNQYDRSIKQIKLQLKDKGKITRVVPIEGYDKTTTILQLIINNMRYY